MLLSLALALAFVSAPPAPRASWHPAIGDDWPAALPPRSALIAAPAADPRGVTLAIIERAEDWARLGRALPARVALPRFDARRELALIVIHQGASKLDFHGFERAPDGTRATLRWGPSPYFVAFEGPQLLVVIVSRAGHAGRLTGITFE